MSDKPRDKLLEADRWIRKLSPNKGMPSGVSPQVRVTLIRGFEFFNARSYHNYRDWSDGYIVEAFDTAGNVIAEVSRADLDDALRDLESAIERVNAEVANPDGAPKNRFRFITLGSVFRDEDGEEV